MHTIDLLRGRGIPAKTTLIGVFLAAITVLAPLGAAAALIDRYFTNEASLEVQVHQLALESKKLDSYSEAIREREAMERNKRKIKNLLAQIAEFTKEQIQWSPIFTTLVEHMPEKMIITSLEAVRKNTSIVVPSKDDANTNTRITVPKRSLVIDIAGKKNEDHDDAVMQLRNELASSPALEERLDDVVISHRAGAEEGTVSYEVVCVFEHKR